MVTENRHIRVLARDHPEIGLPGRSGSEAHDETSLAGGFEEGVGLLAQEPTVVALFQVVGEADQFVAVVEHSQPVRATPSVVGGAPGAVEVGHDVQPAGV
jgi:hypothetical protein